MRIRKKTLDKATEQAIAQAATAGVSLPFDRYEDMVPLCGFGRMGLDCKACTQGPCRVNPFDPSNGTTCGRSREGTVAANFLRLVADGAVVNASFAGAQSQAAGTIFEGISMANEGNASTSEILEKAVQVARAGFEALSSVKASAGAVREIQVGFGTLKPDRINILLLGNIPTAHSRKIARELESNAGINLIGAVGGEAAEVAVAGNYGSQEALLVTAGIDGVVAGQACVSPGFLSLATGQGVPVMDADKFNAARLLEGADSHFRMNSGRNLARKFAPAVAVVGFRSTAFGAVSTLQWEMLAGTGIKGVALVGGCNNVAETQDATIVRQAGELLKNDVLLVACGCAGVALARAHFMDPARTASFAGKGLQEFLSCLSEVTSRSIPAVLGAGSCWEIPSAFELAKLFQQRLKLPLMATMPELSRPAGWSSALAIASHGAPTYVGPILPLDGGLETVKLLNEILSARGGALMGPGQVRDPEAVVQLVMSNE